MMIEKNALEGIKVIDLTRVLAGPFSTMILADLGAEVIKIEMPEKGDDSRHFGPFIGTESAYFMGINRNKKSLTLNLKTQRGRGIFLDLVKKSDVVVENYRYGTMERLGLDYSVLKKINPGIVYASITGFGQTGPYRERAAYDGIVQAMSGIMSVTGEKNGKPVRVGVSIGDITAGVFCACGILAALLHRRNTGVGQMVDVAMLDSQIAILENAISRYTVTGKVPGPSGNTHTSIFPFETFPTEDGEIMIAAGNNRLWETLCKALDKPDLARDERFETNFLRGENHDIMYAEIAGASIKKTTETWYDILSSAGIPCSPVNTIDKVMKNPQVEAREMIVEITHELAGKILIPGIPIKMNETPGRIRAASPVLGQHTEEVLVKELKMDMADIRQLSMEGIV